MKLWITSLIHRMKFIISPNHGLMTLNTMFVCNRRKGRKRGRGREGERKKKEEKKFYQCVWI